jgi:hypothetical protein
MGDDRTPKLVAGQKSVIVLEIKNPIPEEEFDAELKKLLQKFTANQNDKPVPLAARITTLVTSFVKGPPPQ